jgi:hypothetical protein
MLVIGSQALMVVSEKTPENIARQQRADFDVVMTPEEFSKWTKDYSGFIKSLYPTSDHKYKAIVEKDGKRKQYEIELGFEGTSSKWLYDHEKEISSHCMVGFLGDNERYYVMGEHFQMLTKRSHLIYPVHFEKNMSDYQRLKSVCNTSLEELLEADIASEYYTLRSNEAKQRFKQRTPKLNVTTEDFFSSKLPVDTYFVHDHIHKVMAIGSVPAYTLMQKDKSKAWCEKDMFFNLPHGVQVCCVQEEAYVIALERYILPQYGEDCNDPFACYKKALKRICTTLTSGWFRDFAIENYNHAIMRYDENFVDKFANAFNDYTIKPKDGVTINDIPLFKLI